MAADTCHKSKDTKQQYEQLTALAFRCVCIKLICIEYEYLF